MADTDTDASLQQVQTSYGDVNTALEKLLANISSGGSNVTMADVNDAITTAVNNATANLVKSASSDTINDSVPEIGITKAGVPWFSNSVTGALEYLATASVVAGGVVPQVIGMTGNVTIQVFQFSGLGSPINVVFPTAFKPGTVPIVFAQGQSEPPGGYGRVTSLMQSGNSNSAGYGTSSVTNTGASIGNVVLGSAGNYASGLQTIMNVIAIGVM